MIEGLKPFYNSVLRPFARFMNKAGIHPNHITLSGVALFIGAGWFASRGEWLIALLLVISGSLLDGLDGVLARESGKKSLFGAILDSSSDRLTEIVLLFGVFIYYLHNQIYGYWGAYLCFAGICGSMMVSYVKARCEGVGIPCKGGLLQRPERLILLSFGLLLGAMFMLWILAGLAVFTTITMIQRLFEAARECRKQETTASSLATVSKNHQREKGSLPVK